MMIKNLSISIVLLISNLIVFGQHDTLLELGINNTLRAFYNSNLNNPNWSSSKNYYNLYPKNSLNLPFIDDFSQNYIYPDDSLWEDIDAYVNSSFPDNPPTFGVATLDGLDYTGYPYNFAQPTSYGIADHLTSRKINLTSVIDSVFLSFYYQPQGNGNKPEVKDSIQLEFFRVSDNKWVRMWGAPGAANQPFKQVMIPVTADFQSNEFQFRFRNWATLSGNVDHWNIDYVYLDENRNHADTALNDVSFITNHHEMLADFTAMPWTHYLTDTIGLMATTMDVTYKNNHNSTYAVFYEYEVHADNGSGGLIQTYPALPSSKNVLAYAQLTEPQAVYQPAAPSTFTFPSDFSAQTKVFQIRNHFSVSPPDIHTNNDTVLSYQVFGNYYAYDDGSAETGYGVQGIGSKLAYEFDIKMSDTLKSFSIYFSPITNNLVAQTVRLKVWSSIGTTDVEVYSQPVTLFTSPIYSNTNEFLNYDLDVPVYLTAGTYYFGWEKITQEFLNVGWDVNTNNKTKVHFNAVGVWQTSSFDGSLMLRPVFGSSTNPTVNVDNLAETVENFEIYPNPSSNTINFNIVGKLDNHYTIQLIDVHGRNVIETKSSISNRLDVSTLSNGIYFIRFTNIETNNSVFKKVIISK